MPNDHDWPEWLDEVSDGLQDIYWSTKGNRPEKFEIAVAELLTTLQQIEEAYLQEEISERCEEIFKQFANTTLDTLRLAQKTLKANRGKGVGTAPLLDEMTKLLKANPDLLKKKSDAKLAKALSEASPLGIKFSRMYVHKYRERIEKALS